MLEVVHHKEAKKEREENGAKVVVTASPVNVTTPFKHACEHRRKQGLLLR